jgi:twinkle protein
MYDYFDSRGISKLTLRLAKVSEGLEWLPQTKTEVNCVQFNYFLNDTLVNVKYRDGKKNFKLYKGAEKVFYNLDSIKLSDECVIVEGEVDALSFIEADIHNVVSVPNGFNLQGSVNLDYLDNYLNYFDNKEKIYLCLDNDEAGKKGEAEFLRRLGAERCYLVDLKDCKDANAFLIKYGAEALNEAKNEAKISPLEEVITLEDIEESLDEFWLKGFERGMTIDLESLDEFWLKGFERGMTIDLEPFDDALSFILKQYTLVTGVPQSGKSEFLDYITTKLNIKYGHKVGYLTPENEPFAFHYDKLFQKIHGFRPSTEKDLSSLNVINTKQYIKKNYYHVKFDRRYYLQDVLKKFEELVKRKGVRLFVLDPFNKIKLKGGEKMGVNQYTEEYHALIDEFVKKFDAHVFLVLHPNKTKLKEGSEKTYLMPSAYDMKGGGEHFDMSYNILGVNREYECRLVHVKTLKVKFRHLGENQKDCFFSFNTINGRYIELQHQIDKADVDVPVKPLDNTNWITKKTEEIEIQTEIKPVIQPNKEFDMLPDVNSLEETPF